MEKVKISAIVLTYNEENNIERCLKSIVWADELIVVDSFSNDKTVEICRKYTDKIYINEFKGYATQRNFALTKTANEWVIFIDADEMLTIDAENEIRLTIKNDQYTGYYLSRKNHAFGKWLKFGGNYPDCQLRLFKRETVKYEQEVHEKVIISGKVGYLNTNICHYPYNDLNTYFEDFNRYTSLEAMEMRKSGRSLNWIKIFIYPPAKFGYTYFIKLGFLDGWQGFLMSLLGSCYMLVKYLKYKELVKDAYRN